MLFSQIANAMEKHKKAHRWNGGGAGSMALMLGFKRPHDNDSSGVWKHPIAGAHPDKVIPAIVATCLENYFKHCGQDDMIITVSRINRFIKPMLEQLEDERLVDEHGPVEARDHVDEIIDLLKQVVTSADQLLVDEM